MKFLINNFSIIKIIFYLKTMILSWLQDDGTRGSSKDQLKGK